MIIRTFFSRIYQVGKQSGASWIADYAPSMGAALAYYTIFSIAPLLVMVIAVAGLVFGQQVAHGAIMDQLRGLLGPDGATAIEGLLRSASSPKQGWISTAASMVTMVIGATTVFGELHDDLNRIWRAPAKQGSSGLWSLVRTRILSFGMVLAIGFLLVVSLVASAAISGLGKWWSGWFGRWELLLHLFNFTVDLCLITLFFAIIYKFMPRVRVRWRDVWLGAAVTALLFSAGKTLIGLYLGKASIASNFGTAGSLIIALLWTYYAAQIFLFGAEFASVYARCYGSLRAKPASDSPAAGERAREPLSSAARAPGAQHRARSPTASAAAMRLLRRH